MLLASRPRARAGVAHNAAATAASAIGFISFPPVGYATTLRDRGGNQEPRVCAADAPGVDGAQPHSRVTPAGETAPRTQRRASALHGPETNASPAFNNRAVTIQAKAAHSTPDHFAALSA